MGKSPKETGGPVVKSGPTSGQVRSKNNDGTWRKKRSDTGKPKKKDSDEKSSGGLCFITTAACQFMNLPDDCYQLEILRDFREKNLLKTEQGKELVDEYDIIAPKIVKNMRDKSDYEYVWRAISSCVNSLEKNDTQLAISQYKEMVAHLKKKLLLEETH